jgi:hypothetical protein
MNTPIIVLGSDNSSLPFCDIPCYQTFAFYQDTDTFSGAKKLKRSPHNCYHCAGCGRLVYEAKSCMIHDTVCPDWIWYASYPTTYDFMETYINYSRSGIPDLAFEIADAIASTNMLISGSNLAMLTIKRLESF